MLSECSYLSPNFWRIQDSTTKRMLSVNQLLQCNKQSNCKSIISIRRNKNLEFSLINIFRKSFHRSRIYGTKNLSNRKHQQRLLQDWTAPKRIIELSLWNAKWLTWTCQFWGSSSSETHNLGWSLGTDEEGLSIHEMRSNFIRASSCQRVTLLKRCPNSDHFVAFLQRCSKFVSTSYAAGPSILQCKSCHGCLGPLVPAYTNKWKNEKYISSNRHMAWKKHH